MPIKVRRSPLCRPPRLRLSGPTHALCARPFVSCLSRRSRNLLCICYVPSAATNKLAPMLAEYGVEDPDTEWDNYLLLRPWDEAKFLASLRAAENTPRSQLKPDGNHAVIYCSTTDPYQVIHHPDPARQRELADHARLLVRRSLELIRDHSTLNVRILTRSPLAQTDFDLFRSFGKRLVFGMSLPTLRNDLVKVYEPKAPQRTSVPVTARSGAGGLAAIQSGDSVAG